MALGRNTWENARERFSVHTDSADDFVDAAQRELDEQESDGLVALTYAALSIGRRLEALGDLVIDFLEGAMDPDDREELEDND